MEKNGKSARKILKKLEDVTSYVKDAMEAEYRAERMRDDGAKD